MVRTVGELRTILNDCADDVKLIFQGESGNKLTDVRIYPSFCRAVDSGVWFSAQGAQEARDEKIKIRTFKKSVLVIDL
jgi:hypothetical protein